MLRLFFILLISLSSLFLSAQNRPPFRVVFWNTENFFDTRHDSLKNDMEFLPHSMRHWNHRRYKKKLDNVARIIGKSNRAFFQNDWYKKTLSICQK